MFINREISKEIKILNQEFPIIAVLGPRQSGKTMLVKNIFPKYKYISLEDLDIRKIAQQDPRGFLKKYNNQIIIDEAQRVPELFSYLQTHLDNLGQKANFVITGSHNYLLMEKISQSLAGRIGLTTLLPLSINEIKKFNTKLELNDFLFQGSYPRIYDQKIRPTIFYQSYVSTYIERDVRLLKNITNHDAFLKFLKIMAGRTGQILNTLAIADECDLSHNTVKEWISVLETSYLIFKLQPFYKNYRKRLIKNPKIYFYDTGLVCYLLSIRDKKSLDNFYLKGNIFETFIISEILKNNYNQGELANFYFWQDSRKKEVDLLIEKNNIIKSIEIKLGQTIRDDFFKNLNYWQNLTNNQKQNSYVVYGGKENLIKNYINIIKWDSLFKI